MDNRVFVRNEKTDLDMDSGDNHITLFMYVCMYVNIMYVMPLLTKSSPLVT